jgi:hypothetical protein
MDPRSEEVCNECCYRLEESLGEGCDFYDYAFLFRIMDSKPGYVIYTIHTMIECGYIRLAMSVVVTIHPLSNFTYNESCIRDVTKEEIDNFFKDCDEYSADELVELNHLILLTEIQNKKKMLAKKLKELKEKVRKNEEEAKEKEEAKEEEEAKTFLSFNELDRNKFKDLLNSFLDGGNEGKENQKAGELIHRKLFQ